MKLRERVAWNLRAARTARKVTQEILAVDAGVDRTTISGLERADYNASLDVLEKIATALGVDAIRLFDDPPENASKLSGLKPGRKSD